MGLLQNIREGKYDSGLDSILEEVKNRKEALIYDLKPGDKVRFTRLARPEYLAGKTATILEWRRSRVLIQLDEGQYWGKFLRGGGKIIAYPSSLEPYDGV